jgi:hypothetical protein
MPPRRKTAEQRFNERINYNGPVPSHCPELGPCHEWTGRLGTGGYGELSVNGKKEWAHRFAYESRHGKLPPKICVLHRCDNRRCVRDAHHFTGTLVDNRRDCVEKGRQAKGEVNASARTAHLRQGRLNGSHTKPEARPRGAANGRAKAEDKKIDEIKALYAQGGITQASLAARYGYSQTGISAILRGKVRSS